MLRVLERKDLQTDIKQFDVRIWKIVENILVPVIFVLERLKDSRSKSRKVVNRSDKSNDNNNRYRNKKKTSVENLVHETEGRV